MSVTHLTLCMFGLSRTSIEKAIATTYFTAMYSTDLVSSGFCQETIACKSDDLSSPWRPAHLNARSQSSTFSSIVAMHIYILLSVVLSSFSPSLSVQNLFLTMGSSSFLITCPYQLNRLSVICLNHALLSLSTATFILDLIFACHSTRVA